MLILLFSLDVTCKNIDSLKVLLSSSQGVAKCNILTRLAYEYIDVDNHAGLAYSRKALAMAKMLGDSYLIVRSSYLKALSHQRMGKLDSAIFIYSPMLSIAEKNGYINEVKLLLNALANVYLVKAEYDKSLEYHFRSLELREKSGTKEEISITLNNLGLIFYKLDDFDKALTYYERSLKIKNEDNIKIDRDFVLVNIALCYANKRNFKESIIFVKKAVAACAGTCDEALLLSVELCSGIACLFEGNDVEAERHFLQSLHYAKGQGDERFQLDNIIYLSQIYLKRNDLVNVERYLGMAERFTSNGTPYNLELIKLYDGFFKLFEKLGNFERTAFYQKKYIQLKDTIFDEELTTNLMRIEVEYISREHRAKTLAKNQILSLNQEVINRQKLLNVFIGAFAILSMVLVFILLKNNRARSEANRRLEDRVRERTDELERNRHLLERSLYQRNIQMTRVSNDVKQTLVTIKGLCFLGIKETEDVMISEYMQKIDLTSDKLLTIVNRFVNTQGH